MKILSLFLLLHLVVGKKTKKAKRPGFGMVRLQGGPVTLGGDEKSGSPGTKDTHLQAYKIDATSVTNKMWRVFVKETKYVSEAETFQWSFVFDPLVSEKTREENPQVVESALHWRAVQGAYWRKPEGRHGPTLKDRWDYPAVHISKTDAETYCEHYGLRLPTEAEWEFAAQGGVGLYPWGTKAMSEDQEWMMNIFQGAFPNASVAEDGYLGLAPVRAYEPSEYGVYGMLGNVWEWTQSSFKTKDPKQKQFVLKGGSFVDSIDGAFNHKVTATTRMGNDADSGGQNTGFRCVKGRGGGSRAPPDQELMQKIIAEEGVEGLQKFLAKQGGGHQVMTAGELKKRKEERDARNEHGEL